MSKKHRSNTLVIKYVVSSINDLHKHLHKLLPLHIVKVIDSENKKKKIKQSLEKLLGSIHDIPLKCLCQDYDKNVLCNNILIQVLCAYGYLSINSGFSHGDLEVRNVLVRSIDLEKQPEYTLLIYIVGHVAYIVETQGLIFVLCDFDTSMIGTGITQRLETINNDVIRFTNAIGKLFDNKDLCNLSREYRNNKLSRCAPIWFLREYDPIEKIDVTALRLTEWLEWQKKGICTLLFIHNDIQTRTSIFKYDNSAITS